MDEQTDIDLNETPKKSNSFTYIVIGVIVFSILYIVYGRSKTNTSANPIVTEVSKIITLEQIATHNANDSCWTAINGEVFDVTKFTSMHKGGDKILAVCGIDGTDLFTGKSSMGRVHSQMATKLLDGMKIGNLQ